MQPVVSEDPAGGAADAGPRRPARGLARYGRRSAFAAVLLFAAGLNLYRLDQEGYANLYYSATVWSMLASWHNFFFASYDPGGLVSVDKPPLGYWIQAISAWLLGYNGVSMLLPQALAGVASAALLYHLVGRAFGAGAGLLAALALALTPVAVAANRNNTVDSLLLLSMLLAAWAVTRAVEQGRPGWLLLAAAFLGLGFNIKMLQAYMVLPAIFLLYLLAAPVPLLRRLAHLAAAALVLLAVSLAWVAVFDLTPADRRPYAGSSATNSMLELAIGYNGLERLTRDGVGNNPGLAELELGPRGPLRLLGPRLAGQISWLLPLAFLGVLLAGWRKRAPETESGMELPGLAARRRHAVWLWALWLAPQIAFYSVAGFYHRYYLITLAPGIAALAAIAVATLWQDWRAGRRPGWLLPLALVGSAAAQAFFLWSFARPEPGIQRGAPNPATQELIARIDLLMLAVVGVATLAAAALVLSRVVRPLRAGIWPAAALLAGIAASLIVPAIWSALPLAICSDRLLPHGGPPQFECLPEGYDRFEETRVLDYLRANRAGARYLVATISWPAPSLIVYERADVMPLGGFIGTDEILTPEELAQRVARNDVRFFLLDTSLPAGHAQHDLLDWALRNCPQAAVRPETLALRGPCPTAGAGQIDLAQRR